MKYIRFATALIFVFIGELLETIGTWLIGLGQRIDKGFL